MLCAKLSPELEAVDEVGLSTASLEVQQGTRKRLRAGKGAESKTTSGAMRACKSQRTR